jgi:hypothetical protein
VTAKDRGGNTALHMAAQEGDIAVVKELIAKGADANAKTAKSQGGGVGARAAVGEQTPLLLAAKGNHVDIMRALVAARADPKANAQDGTTLLMAAAASGHLAAVQYAFELGGSDGVSDIRAVTDRKQTVMHVAVGASLQTSTQQEICDVLAFLAGRGAELDALDAGNRTPLMIVDVTPGDHAPLKMQMAVDLLRKLIRASGAEPRTADRL